MKFNRKNQTLAALLFFVSALACFSSCRKTAEDVIEIISESEAAEIVETAITERTAGMSVPTVDMAQILETYLENCGVPGDTTLQRSNSGANASYDYTFGLEWLVNCNDLGIPQNAAVDVTGDGTFSTNRWSGDEQATGTLTFTGLNPQATAYIVNGSYTLEGDITGDLRRVDPTFNCTTTIALVEVTISKSTYKITGGGGTIQITGTNGQGNTRTLNGTLTFNGDGTVTVVVNGHSHTFPV